MQNMNLQVQKASQDTQTGGDLSQNSEKSPQKSEKNQKKTLYPTITPTIRIVNINDYCYSIYSTLHKITLAVHESLDKSIMQGQAVRQGKQDFIQHQAEQKNDQKFYTDSKFYENTYKVFSFDRGHMAPAKNYCSDKKLMISTFTYANCIPQNSYFNRGSWKNLQSYCRNLIRNDICERIQIISGPVFYSDSKYQQRQEFYENHQIVLMKYGIIVPPKCYKIIKAIHKNQSYVAAFVMKNQKNIDNDMKINSFTVPVEQLQLMTGLTFNLGQYKPLEQLDKVGMNKTMGDLHIEAFTKLFKLGQSLADLNGARKQGLMYHVKIDIKTIPEDQKIKMGLKDAENIINQVGWQRVKVKSRRKINSLLTLHRDAKQVGGLSEQLQKIIVTNIQSNLQGSKNEEKDKLYHKYICKKLYGNNYGYVYPCEDQLKKIFFQINQKDQKDQNEHSNQQSLIQNSNSIPFQLRFRQKKQYKKEQSGKKLQQGQKVKKPRKAKKVSTPSTKVQNKKQSDSDDQASKTEQTKNT